MKIEPIKIDIEDKRLYAQIAFLVDRPDFMKDIQQIKQEHQIDPSFQAKDYFKTATDESLFFLTEIKSRLLNKVAEIRQKYSYPPYFDDVIFQAILFHRVSSIKATQVITHLVKRSPEAKYFSENDIEMAILITPLSTQKEVLEAFEESKKLRSEYEERHPIAPMLDKDTLTNIVRDRKWHLDQSSGRTYSEILEDWNNSSETHYKEDCPKMNSGKKRCELCKIDDENDIVKAVSRYRKSLKSAFLI